jgi:MFS family permease
MSKPTNTLDGTRVASVVGFLVFIELTVGIGQGMVPVLIPKIASDLHVSAGAISWVTSVQLCATAVCVPLFARLGDMYGHRRMLRIAILVLAAGTLLVAWSPSYPALLLGRILQGTVGAMGPLQMGIVRDRLNAQGARQAIGMLIGALVFGGSAGVILAGLLAKAMNDFHGVLWVPAAMTVLCIPVVYFLVPESRTRAPRARVDWLGAALLSLGLIAGLLSLAKGNAWGWTSGKVVGLFAAAVLLLAAWVVAELRTEHPIVDLRLSSRRNLLPVYVASFLFGGALFGAQSAGGLFLAAPPRLFHYGFGYNTLQIGWISLPNGLCAFAAAAIVARLGKAIGVRRVLVIGGVLAATGYAWLTLRHGAASDFLMAGCLLGFGTGLVLGSLPALVLDAAPADRTSIAIGIDGTSQTLGGSIAGAVFATVLTTITFGHTKVPTEHAYVVVWSSCGAICVAMVAAALTVRSTRVVNTERVGTIARSAGHVPAT